MLFAACDTFSLLLLFASLITVCLGVFLLGFILPGTLCFSWTWLIISFPILLKFSANSSNIFSGPFSLSAASGTPTSKIHAFNAVPEVSQAISICFHSFFCILFRGSDFHHSASQVIYLCFSLWMPSSVVFITVSSLVLVDLW